MKRIVIPICICISLCSCEKDDCKNIGMVQIEETLIPDTAISGDPVPISITASATNLCWSGLYAELKEEEKFNYSIQAYGTFTCCQEMCPCAESMVYKDTVMTFHPTQKGMYLFSISKWRDSVAVDTMIVR